MTTRRREFLKGSGAGLLAFSVGGVQTLLTAREARARDVPLVTLNTTEAALIERLGEVLAPGAREAGIAHFLDQQLSAPVEQCLLLARVLAVEPPYAPLYRGGCRALDAVAGARHGRGFAALAEADAVALVTAMSAGTPEGWDGPPAPLFYTLVRSDAVDVVYGTVEGFEDLGIPYMPHILPPARW